MSNFIAFKAAIFCGFMHFNIYFGQLVTGLRLLVAEFCDLALPSLFRQQFVLLYNKNNCVI